MAQAATRRGPGLPSVAAAYLAEEAVAATENLSVKVKYTDGRSATANLIFKDTYRDEYTNEDLPMAMCATPCMSNLSTFVITCRCWFPSNR